MKLHGWIASRAFEKKIRKIRNVDKILNDFSLQKAFETQWAAYCIQTPIEASKSLTSPNVFTFFADDTLANNPWLEELDEMDEWISTDPRFKETYIELIPIEDIEDYE